MQSVYFAFIYKDFLKWQLLALKIWVFLLKLDTIYLTNSKNTKTTVQCAQKGCIAQILSNIFEQLYSYMGIIPCKQ